jgi:hypothetical protein
MRSLRAVQTLLLLAALASPVVARDYVFEGTWRTTNRPLDGRMTCVVTDLGDQKWLGRFYGVWQGVAFDYNVPFSGPLSELRGTAVIDGSNYTWAARIDEGTPGTFHANFDGDRYRGSFELTEQVKATSSPTP